MSATQAHHSTPHHTQHSTTHTQVEFKRNPVVLVTGQTGAVKAWLAVNVRCDLVVSDGDCHALPPVALELRTRCILNLARLAQKTPAGWGVRG